MDYGSLIQLGTMGYNMEMQGRAKHRSNRQIARSQQAEDQYGGYAQQDMEQLQQYLRGLSQDRLRNAGTFAAALSGPDYTAAGQAGEEDDLGRLQETLGGAGQTINAASGGINRGGPAASLWRQRAAMRSMPRLSSQANLVGIAGRRAGESRFTQEGLNQLSEADTTLGRRGNEAQQRSTLLDAYRRRKLSEILRANGVDNVSGLLNQGQTVQALGNIAGGALNSYMANRPSASSDSSHQANLDAASPGGSGYNAGFSQYQGAH